MYRRLIFPSSALVTLASVYTYKKREIQSLSAQEENRKTLTYERLSLKQVYDRFKIKDLTKKEGALGEGAYGHVVGCTETNTGKSVALKIVKKAFTKASNFDREVTALRAARIHPNIVQLLDVIDVPEADAWLLVTELLEGGELFDKLLNKGPFSELGAAKVISKVASALSCLHKLGWAHNDIKPENIVYVSKLANSDIKLIDFGMARRHSVKEDQIATKDLGTTAYWSPEMLNSGARFLIDPRVIDAWTLGVLTYILLYACHPFDRSGDSSEDEIAKRIAAYGSANSYLCFDCFDDDIKISPEAKDLIEKLLHPDPDKRMKVDEVFSHPWIIENVGENLEMNDEEEQIKGSITERPRRLRGERDAQQALTTLLKMATENSAYRDFFHNLSMTDNVKNSKDVQNFQFELDKRHIVNIQGIIYDIDDPTNGIYVLAEGSAVIEYPSDSGEFIVVQQLLPGDVFGETAILEGRSARNARVRTLNGQPIKAYFFGRDDVVAVLSSSSELKERLEELSSRRYRIRAANALFERKDSLELKSRSYKKGDIIFRKGEPSENLYWIKTGIVKSIIDTMQGDDGSEISLPTETPLERALGKKTYRNRRVLAEWGPGDVFGISALYGSARFATAVAETPVQLIELNRSELERVLKHEPTLRENLTQQFRTFKERSFFGEKKARLDLEGEVITLKRGEILFKQGDISDGSVYFVQFGQIEMIDNKGNVRYVNSEGQTFGNESFVKKAPRIYTAVVVSETAKVIKVSVGELP